MAAALALVAAMAFALAAALQQRGEFALARDGAPVHGLGGLLRLVVVPVWLLGTLLLLLGYAVQGVALDGGQLVVVQPLLVTTVVWALPLGHWLTRQTVVSSQAFGAVVVVVGLALFVLVGDPNAGVDSAAAQGLVIAIFAVCIAVAVLLLLPARTPNLRAALLGVSSGLLFGLSASFAKPVLHDLTSSGLADVVGDWQTWALLGFGFGGFVLQQLSLATGQLAPAMATVSVTNPALSVILGILLYNEQLTRPAWHVVVATAALLAAMAGATMITMANRETQVPDGPAPADVSTSVDRG